FMMMRIKKYQWILAAGPLLAAGFFPLAWGAGVEFNHAFAPQDGLVSQYEEPLRQEICLNGRWQFQGDEDKTVPGETVPSLGHWDQTAIKIPSPWNVNAFSMDGGMPGGDFRTYPSYP